MTTPAQSQTGEHTPGPWKVIKGAFEGDDMRCAVVVERGGVQYLLATIENGAPGDFCETEEANAKLIASSPEMKAELEDMQMTLDLRWKADMRAINRWRAANPGNDLTLPDHADLVVWLLEQLEAAERLRAPVGGCGKTDLEILAEEWGKSFTKPDCSHPHLLERVKAGSVDDVPLPIALSAMARARQVKEVRDDREEIKRLKAALETIASGTEDIFPPFRAMPRESMQNIARIALKF